MENFYISFIKIIKDTLFIANIFFIITIIFVERKNPVYSLFWITILSLTSYFGFIAYLMFGLSFRKKRLTKKFYKRNMFRDSSSTRGGEIEKLKETKQLIDYLEISGKSRLTFSNDVEVFIDGEALFKKIIEDIKGAKSFIHLEYFIFSYDSFGREVGELLMEKSKNGVEVRMIVDGVGSRSLPRSYIRKLKKSGIQFKYFFPLYISSFPIRANYRTHRKILTIDGRLAYIGGFNIGDDYINKGHLGHWRDTHLRLEGSIVTEIQKEFFSSWAFAKNQSLLRRFKSKKPIHNSLINYFPVIKKEGSCPMQLVSSAPDYDFRLIRDGFLKIISRAKDYVYLHTPYFIPDEVTFTALKVAALSGVKIKIIIPNKPDHMMVYWATTSYVGELLDYGIEFYTYDKGFLHSKTIISDDLVASVGSSNFDHRSFHQNFEINIFTYDHNLILTLKKAFIGDLKFSTKLSLDVYSKRKTIIKFKESVSRLFSPIL